MAVDYEVFEQALDLFHHYSRQNVETVRQMQAMGLLPTGHRHDFSVLDIGAGQGHLPGLMQDHVGTLVLLEPNPRCVHVLQRRFAMVYPCRWEAAARERLRQDYPQGFDLITMSHMLYHFDGIDDIREKIRMALTLLKPSGHLVIVIIQPFAPTARIGVSFQEAEGLHEIAATNKDLHASCHGPDFYQHVAGEQADVDIVSVDAPLYQVQSREDLIGLLRMALLNPLSEAPCDIPKLDAFIAGFLDAEHPRLAYPATIPSRDNLIVLRKGLADGLSTS